MVGEVVKLPVRVRLRKRERTADKNAEHYASDETERRRHLFDWAEGVLGRVGVTDQIAAANSVEVLRSLTFDENHDAIILSIQEALHPADGTPRQAHFRGLTAGSLKQILKNRFNALKKIASRRCAAAAAMAAAEDGNPIGRMS